MFNFNCSATITISEDEVRSVIVQALKEKYNLVIQPDRLKEEYKGSYDSEGFDGYKIELDMDEAVQIRGLS